MSDEIETAEDDSHPVKFRSDVTPAGIAPRKKRGRPPKVRHDSEVSGPGDGYGNPLDVKMAPGWVGCFVTDADLDRLIGRPWVPVCWGDPHLKQYVGTRPGKKGEQIAFKELKLFKMSAADAAAVNANDWRRRDHIAAGRGLFDYAKSTGGRVERHEKTQTIFARD